MLIYDLYISIHGLKPRPGFLIAFSYRPVGRKLYILVISIHSRAMTNQAITFLKVFDLFCDVWKYLKDFIWDGSLIFYNLFEIHQDLKNNSKIRVDLAAIKDKKKPPAINASVGNSKLYRIHSGIMQLLHITRVTNEQSVSVWVFNLK